MGIPSFNLTAASPACPSARASVGSNHTPDRARTKDFLNKYRLNVCLLSPSVLSHRIDINPVPFTFLGMVIWGEGVSHLGHAKHPLDRDFLICARNFGRFPEPVLRHKTAINEHRRSIGPNERHDDMVACGPISSAWADDYGSVMIPLSTREHLPIDEFRDDCQTDHQQVSPLSDNNMRRLTHLILGGNIKGSRLSFSSSSSMRLTFHLSRCTCHVPRAKVKKGIIPTRTMAGVSHGYRRAF